MQLLYKAYAKVNLTLEVLKRRPDGFHEVATVLQSIDLADELTFEPASELLVQCDNPAIPEDEDLVLLAACLLRQAINIERGAKITVNKRIPLAAGLGGGSSDAATALQGLNTLWELDLPRPRLASLAAELGSDVPFFLWGGTALAEGRGEVVTPLPDVQQIRLVLAFPPLRTPTKTAMLYGKLRPAMFTDGAATRRLVEAIESGAPLASGRPFMNVFEQVAEDAFPGLEEYKRRFKEAGASTVHLCGSGPTLFTMVRGSEEGLALQERCAALGLEARLVSSVAAPA